MKASRRGFLAGVGEGMFIASIGPALAAEMSLGRAFANEPSVGSGGLTFGGIEPLVDLMQQLPPDKLLPAVVEKLHGGTRLQQVVAAAALANARAFGGEDYIGFHTLMAMSPAYRMAMELPEERRALPVLKVLYRNSSRLQESGQADSDTLNPVLPRDGSTAVTDAALREAVRRKDLAEAERIYARLANGSADDALNNLLLTVQDATEVHRVVLVWRAWSMLDLVGQEQAHTMLRQSVRFCVKSESESYARNHGGVRTLLPRLFDQYRLLSVGPFGSREADDAWVDRFSQTLFNTTPDQAAEAVAAALVDGLGPEAISQAIALAANQLVLRDAGRPEQWASSNKPPGSVHGDSVGVHACDAVNAWCNIARVSNPRNTAAALMLAGYEVARDRAMPSRDMAPWKPRPLEEDLVKVKGTEPRALLDEAESAIRNNDQSHACAVVARYGALGHAPRPVFDLMLRYAVSEDGALHAEKYYQTVSEEFARSRPAFRWRQLIALARVTASAHGYPAPGLEQARDLLNV